MSLYSHIPIFASSDWLKSYPLAFVSRLTIDMGDDSTATYHHDLDVLVIGAGFSGEKSKDTRRKVSTTDQTS